MRRNRMPMKTPVQGKLKVHFSSETDEWATPRFLFEALDAEFGFTLDPAATPVNAKCRRFFTRLEDGLAQNWTGHTVFLNPPYGREIGLWVRKAFLTAASGSVVVCLLPARTDTRWWHDYVSRGEVRFLKGRLQFEGGQHCAPFPSAVVVFRPWKVAPSYVEIRNEQEVPRES